MGPSLVSDFKVSPTGHVLAQIQLLTTVQSDSIFMNDICKQWCWSFAITGCSSPNTTVYKRYHFGNVSAVTLSLLSVCVSEGGNIFFLCCFKIKYSKPFIRQPTGTATATGTSWVCSIDSSSDQICLWKCIQVHRHQSSRQACLTVVPMPLMWIENKDITSLPDCVFLCLSLHHGSF